MPRTTSPQSRLDAVTRSLELIWEAGGGVSVTHELSCRLDAPARQVWSALTRAEPLGRWFAPVSGTLRAGGRFALEGGVSGSVLECTAHRRLVLTWESDGTTSDVVVEVEPEGDGARLRLLHAAMIGHEPWTEFGAGAGGVGWDLALLGLQRHLDEGAPTPPGASEWITSPSAREFLADSSRRWADASIEAGTPIEEARAAAERTTAFYLGEEP